MLPCNGVTRIKLRRDSFKLDGKLEPNKRRWTGPKTAPGFNPPAESGCTAPEAAGVASPERASCSDCQPSSEHRDEQGTFPSRVCRDCRGGGAESPGAGVKSPAGSEKKFKRLSEHKKEFFYRLRVALCFARKKLRNGGKRVTDGSTDARAQSCINGRAPVGSVDSVEQTLPALDSTHGLVVGIQSRRGRGRPRKRFFDGFDGSNGQGKTTFKTEVRSKVRRSTSGCAANFSSNVELRRRLRSDTRKHCKRLVKNACCALCGEVKYTPPPKNLAGLLGPRSRAGRPGLTTWQKGARPIAESRQTPSTPVFRFEKYPMVKLCDVARVFGIASRDFSCVLPAALRQKRTRKRVCCLKKEFSFLVHPHLHSIKKCASNFANLSWEVSTPTHSCASLSSGDSPCGATGSMCVSDTAETPGGSVREWDSRNPVCGRPRLSEVAETAQSDDNDPVVCFCDKEKACPMKDTSESPSSPARRVSPLVLRRIAVNGCALRSEDDVEDGGPSLDEGEEDRGNEVSDEEESSPESFSCQRTQAYIFFPKSSCARTCKTWPFPRTGPPLELGSSCPRPRWIVSASFLACAQSSLGVAPECLSVSDKLSKPTMQSVSTDEAREVLEALPLSSPQTDRLAVLERTPKASNPRGVLAQESYIFKPPDLQTRSGSTNELERQSVNLSAFRLERAARGAMLAHVSKPEEFESNLIKKRTKDATIRTELVNNYNINALGTVALLEGSGLSKNHSILKRSDEKVLSGGLESHSPVSREEDVSDPRTTVSQTSRDQSQNGNRQILYTPGSLSEMCLKVEMLKAQRPPLVPASSTVKRTALSDAACAAVCSGGGNWKRKRKQVFDRHRIIDSSSEEENEHVSCPPSDEKPGEQDAPESSPSHDENDGGTSRSLADNFLDVSRAYEEDVLVLDVIQDDPELFGAVITETTSERNASSAENGNIWQKVESKHQTRNQCKIVWDLKKDCSSKSLPTAADVRMDPVSDGGSPTVQERFRAPSGSSMNISNTLENATDWNNNQETRDANGLHCIAVINSRAARPVLDSSSNGREVSAKETSALRALNSSYCWFYFSEQHTCLRSVCWFLHVPRDGDEKFCMEMVMKFCHAGKHALVLRAVEVLMGYYSKCSPGVSFSPETVNSLLSSLVNMSLLREFVAVINLLLSHKRLPPPEIVLAVFNRVRERGLISFVPELILLFSKIVEAGCVFSVDQCEVMQGHLHMMQVSRQQMDIFLAIKCRVLATNPHTSELSDLAQAVVGVEMLKHQEDWAGLARMFSCVCVASHGSAELLRFCCCVTMALLKEPKDKLTLPYEPFAESVCQRDPLDPMMLSILGRIGVSLIFRYHRTREWSKGVKLVTVMFRLHIDFITLKGLMGNEHRVSRCQLVTMATELFLHSGSIEGALKMLRADGWFVSSNLWPCGQDDIKGRKRVLTLLAGKTSHRDTFEILTNLPGLRQPIDGVQIEDYTDLFNAHLRLCMIKQTLPVAADVVEFMLTQGLLPESPQLQNLIHKLGKQNNWSRARALFKRAQSASFYSAVVCERDSLFLPCSLSEIEMTLAFEMFITFINASLSSPAGASEPLLITLRRHAEVEDVTESVYLAAGCRLLSAALIPNPKLSIRYTAVNQRQEQLFQLDRTSALKWFAQNGRWAQEVWTS